MKAPRNDGLSTTTAHWEVLAAADFFTVEIWTPTGLARVVVLFVILCGAEPGKALWGGRWSLLNTT